MYLLSWRTSCAGPSYLPSRWARGPGTAGTLVQRNGDGTWDAEALGVGAADYDPAAHYWENLEAEELENDTLQVPGDRAAETSVGVGGHYRPTKQWQTPTCVKRDLLLSSCRAESESYARGVPESDTPFAAVEQRVEQHF